LLRSSHPFALQVDNALVVFDLILERFYTGGKFGVLTLFGRKSLLDGGKIVCHGSRAGTTGLSTGTASARIGCRVAREPQIRALAAGISGWFGRCAG
jgi:hypothetical protein